MAVDPRARQREAAAPRSSRVPRKPGDGQPPPPGRRGPTRHSPPRKATSEHAIAVSNDEAPPLPSPLLRTRTRAATTLRANPYPEVTDRFCRLPLPTLVYAARGCSPRRPAADIGTNQHEDSAWPSPGFSRSAWGSRTPPQRVVLFALASLSPG